MENLPFNYGDQKPIEGKPEEPKGKPFEAAIKYRPYIPFPVTGQNYTKDQSDFYACIFNLSMHIECAEPTEREIDKAYIALGKLIRLAKKGAGLPDDI